MTTMPLDDVVDLDDATTQPVFHGRRAEDRQPTGHLEPPDHVDPDDEQHYQQRLGARLRAVRRGQGLRLQDVEDASGGRFKAVVVGSYERGDRAVSAHKLAALAQFYGVAVADLLPDAERAGGSARAGVMQIDVARLREQADDPALAPLVRLVDHVRWLRGDVTSRQLALRSDDLSTVAIALGIEPDGLGVWLESRGLLAN